MTLFTQDMNKNLVESVSKIMAERVAGENLPQMVREAAIEAGRASVGKGLEERRQIMHRYFNTSSAQAQAEDRAFRPTNETVRGFNEVAFNALNQYEAAEAAGSFEDVADDPGSPLSAEDRARLNKRKVREGMNEAFSSQMKAFMAGADKIRAVNMKNALKRVKGLKTSQERDFGQAILDAAKKAGGEVSKKRLPDPKRFSLDVAKAKKLVNSLTLDGVINVTSRSSDPGRVAEDAEGAGSFEDVADDAGSPLSAEDRARLNKRKVREGAESAGSFEDVADDEGSPLSAEDRTRLNKRKVREAAVIAIEQGLANFGKKKKTFPPDKDGDGKVNEEDSTGTDKPIEDTEEDERRVSVKAKTVRNIDSVPVSATHSFVKESWTLLVNTEGLSIGEQHLLAGKLVEQDEVTEACSGCPTNRQPFTATVHGKSEIEAIENFVSALENVGSPLNAESVLVAHRTPSKGGP